MTVPVEVCLKGDDYATNESIAGIAREPRAWTDADVRLVLEGMLQAHASPQAPRRARSDRRAAWLQLDRESVRERAAWCIAIEITLGAAVAGPFDIDQARLEAMIARVLVSSPSCGALEKVSSQDL